GKAGQPVSQGRAVMPAPALRPDGQEAQLIPPRAQDRSLSDSSLPLKKHPFFKTSFKFPAQETELGCVRR
ncbi:MAG: hypothetical protein M3Q29_26335, partial [Chloroflexota bacterium]|nr:hypothetical protein [Chloroflexota bacterium]